MMNRRGRRPLHCSAALRLVLAAGALCAAGGAFAQQPANQLPSLAPMIERVSPSVVNISVNSSIQINNPLTEDPFFRRFFEFPPDGRREVQSSGSGVIVDAEHGYVLTNHHVIAEADKITITLLDNRNVDARVVGFDEDSDLAVLQIDARNLTEMPLGNSDGLRVGDYVVAIGNPFGLSHTVTSGIVSGLGRTGINRNGYEDFIQTDASINPGNSGGALVDLNGTLVGINSAILSRTGGNIGIGFAIPVNMARDIMNQLIEVGSVRRGLLGVGINDLTPELAEIYGLDTTTGALVASVAPGSAAEKAGIQVEDVIVSVNGNQVQDTGSLRNMIGLMRPGEEVRLGIVREGSGRALAAVLDERTPAGLGRAAPNSLAEIDSVFAGVDLADNARSGVAGLLVVRVDPDSSAYENGLRAGDVVTHINRQRVRSLADAAPVIQNAGSIVLLVHRGNRDQLIPIR